MNATNNILMYLILSMVITHADIDVFDLGERDNEIKFLSIDEINQIHNDKQKLTDYLGERVELTSTVTSVIAVLLKDKHCVLHEKFGMIIPDQYHLRLNFRKVHSYLNEHHIGESAGIIKAAFALVFGEAHEENVVFLVCPPRPGEGAVLWHLIEVNTGMSAAISEEFSKYLSSIYEKLIELRNQNEQGADQAD